MNERSISRDALRAVFETTHSLPGVHSGTEEIMGGHGTITLVGGSDVLLSELWRFAHRAEELWSRFLPHSDISRLNWAEGAAVDVDPLTIELIAAMQVGTQLSEGSYDPTMLPAVLNMGYAASTVNPTNVTHLPDSAVAPGNLSGAVIEGQVVTLPRGTTLDAGGIGKGLLADLVAQRARAGGAWGVMAEFGGDIVVDGQAPDGVAWRLGLEDPFDADQHAAVIRLLRGGVVTSSQRKRRFGEGASATHHVIDAATQQSARTRVQTVTVIASSGARAEVLTKRGFVQNSADYLTWLPTVGAAGFIINEDGSCLTSANWSTYA
jgi:thiamine biosynthesis lipoprotein